MSDWDIKKMSETNNLAEVYSNGIENYGYDYFVSESEGKRIAELKRKERFKKSFLLCFVFFFVLLLIVIEWVIFYCRDLLGISEKIIEYYSCILYAICICSIAYIFFSWENLCLKRKNAQKQRQQINLWEILSTATLIVAVMGILHQYMCSLFGYENLIIVSPITDIVTICGSFFSSYLGKKRDNTKIVSFCFYASILCIANYVYKWGAILMIIPLVLPFVGTQ